MESLVSTDNAGPDPTTLLRALVALQLADRQDRHTSETPRPAEVILADVGISLGEIALLTGRKYETVQTTIRRARAGDKPPPAKGSVKPARKKG